MKLTNVSSKYGAPMGRRNVLPDDTWTYFVMDIKTGETTIVTQNRFSPDCIKYASIYEAVNAWNRSGTWKYWV